ncbi:hypothetical protein [Streptosporangium oxazolinicum]|uniref:hypothetical protein n=1 Tax=Streptosporangium oxazolinicum TaxID=909287 RepID=UPI0031F0398F
MDEESRPFDARKTLMCEDQAAPRTEWQTSSLVCEMQETLRSRLSLDREERAKQLHRFDLASQELTRRGLDAESLVRYGMAAEILGPVLGILLIHQILPESDTNAYLREADVDVEGWRSLLKIPVATDKVQASPHLQELVVEINREVLHPLLSWIRSAELNTLVRLDLPTEEQFWSKTESVADDASLRHRYKWLIERFTETYLANWSLPALHLEYRWQKDIDPIMFPIGIMEGRIIPTGELAAEIAHRTVLDSNVLSDSAPSTLFLMNKLKSHAISLLGDGRHREAAALFTFAVQQWPNDPSAQNNLGFCLLPENATQALEHLNSAARMGYEPYAINAYNRMCCYLEMRHPRTALAIAKDFWEERPDEADTTSVLWKPVNGEWQLAQNIYIRATMAELAARIAHAHGWEDEERVWRIRAEA